MTQGLGQPVRRRDLRNMRGEWSKRQAAELDRFLLQQRQIDLELWK